MTGSGTGWIGVFFVVLVVLVLTIQTLWNVRRARRLSTLAKRWNGQVMGGGLFSVPWLRIQVDGVRGEVVFWPGRRTQAAWTQVRFDRAFRGRLRVTPEGRVSMWRGLARSAEVQVGDQPFDSAHWIESSDVHWARFVLSPDVRTEILRLRREATWFSMNATSLDLGPAGLSFKVDCFLVDDPKDIERLVEVAVLVLRTALGIQADFVTHPVEGVTGSECPVCGHRVDEAAQTCPQCSTPHHKECWTYMGGCAIFACGGRP